MNTRKIRVLRVMRGLNVGGIELRILSLTRALNRTGEYYCAIVTIMDEGDLAEDARKRGEPIVHIPVIHRTNFGGIKNLRDYIRQEKFDIVHTHSFYPNVPGRIAAILARSPVIIAHQHSLFSRKCRRFKHKMYERILAPFTDVIVSVSESVKEDYVRFTGVSPRKLRVVHNGIDLSPFDHEFDVGTLRKELGLEGKIILGSVGRLVPVKGYPTLIESAARVVEKVPDAVFLIVGDGPEEYRTRLEKQIKSLGLTSHVRLLGYRKDIPALMQMMDIGVLSSVFEGFPAVLVEFLASEKPVVATKCGGQTEIVKDNETAILVPPDSPDDLAAAIIRVLEDKDLQERLARAGWDRARDFSLDKMTSNFDALYREFISKKTISLD